MNADSILLLIAAVITWGILYEVKVCVWCVDYEMKLHQENLRRDNESMKVACNTLPMMNQKDKIESLVTDELIIVKKMTNFELLSLILNNLSYCAKCVLLLIWQGKCWEWQGLIVVKWRREDWTRRNKDCCENVKVSCEKVAFVVKVWKGKLQKWMKNVLLKTERICKIDKNLLLCQQGNKKHQGIGQQTRRTEAFSWNCQEWLVWKYCCHYWMETTFFWK